MSNPLKILIVDDNVVNLMLLDRLLRNEGADIFKAENGEDTVALCENNDFALILLDVQMPGMDGYETAKAIKCLQACKLVPIIFLTAIYKDPAYVRMGYEAGAVDFLTQPIDPPTLRGKVGVFLELKRQKDLLEREIAQRIKTEKALRKAEEKYRNIFVRAVEGIFRSTLDGDFIEINPAFARILGFDSPEEALSHDIARSTIVDSKDIISYLETLMRDKYLNDFEMRVTRKDGSVVWVSESSRLFEEDGDFFIEGVVEDVTQRKMCEIDLQEKATLDELTGVPNRYLFFDRLESSLASARRYNEKLALLFIDLDNFKSVNDQFGHHAGDALLLEVANRFKSRLRSSDTLARLGGDEFCVLLERPTDNADIQRVAEDFAASLLAPFEIGEIVCKVGASIGISVFPDNAHLAKDLVQCADSAMYKVKEGANNRFCFFNGADSKDS